MEATGFVLAGGMSTRMGRDKALLELDGETLVARGLRTLGEVCTEVAIAGGAAGLARYGRLIVDESVGCGPLGGIVAALEQSGCEWNLFVPVDVPFVPAEVWRALLERAEEGGAVCVMARDRGQVQPLIAAYARVAAEVLRDELRAGRRKVTEAVAKAGAVVFVDFECAERFRNLNTAEEFRKVMMER